MQESPPSCPGEENSSTTGAYNWRGIGWCSRYIAYGANFTVAAALVSLAGDPIHLYLGQVAFLLLQIISRPAMSAVSSITNDFLSTYIE